MTTFDKNPFAEARKKLNQTIFHRNLTRTLKSKFKHKRFSERFAWSNTAFIGMGGIAQLASMITAFTMLFYLFSNVHIVVRVICAIALVITIEVAKRDSTNDVMQGIFQYKEIELFPIVLTTIAVTGSIYISVQGAQILPSLLITDAVMETPTLKTGDKIEAHFDKQIAALEIERNTYRENRLWKGRLRSEDAAVVEDYNDLIKGLQEERTTALASMETDNQTLLAVASKKHASNEASIIVQREELSDQLVKAAWGFEGLFILSICFSWWYYTECKKENEKEAKEKKQTTTENSDSSAVQQQSDSSTAKNEEDAPAHQAPTANKIGYIDYEEIDEKQQEIEKVKKEFTRICPQCNTGFIHNSHNHTYCSRSCGIKHREENPAA